MLSFRNAVIMPVFLLAISPVFPQRARDYGIITGLMKSGKQNSITDVAGVKVGHTTLVSGDSIRTGVTAILPYGGNIFQSKVPAAIYTGNGFGKLAGISR